MASRGSNLSDLIHRAASSCLLHPLSSRGCNDVLENEDDWGSIAMDERERKVMEEEEEEGIISTSEKKWGRAEAMETLMIDVFETIKDMKRAYIRLQEAHCPYDADRIRVADGAMIGLFKKLSAMRERSKHRRNLPVIENCFCSRGDVMREVVAPYEATIEELKRDMKAKETEMELLKERFGKTAGRGGNVSRRKVGCSSLGYSVAASPGVEMFEDAMGRVREASKSFTSVLLALMRAARWDIAAAVRSIEAATPGVDVATASAVVGQHAKYALESYVSRKMFVGFDHESFYMEGGLALVMNPREFRRECLTQYQDMRGMEPSELLGILPSCEFGKFCGKKYLAMVHPKMEESLFGNVEQREMVMEGKHPRTKFYGDFLGLAKAVWLLHLLSFSLEPSPTFFDATRGADFNPRYMDSVLKFFGAHVPAAQIVAFPICPGFKLGNGTVIKASVYLISRS